MRYFRVFQHFSSLSLHFFGIVFHKFRGCSAASEAQPRRGACVTAPRARHEKVRSVAHLGKSGSICDNFPYQHGNNQSGKISKADSNDFHIGNQV